MVWVWYGGVGREEVVGMVVVLLVWCGVVVVVVVAVVLALGRFTNHWSLVVESLVVFCGSSGKWCTC